MSTWGPGIVPRVLERIGRAYRTPGRLVRTQPGNVELLDGVHVRLSLWKERGAAQRWVSLEVIQGELTGTELFVPIEALQGQEVVDELGRANAVLAT